MPDLVCWVTNMASHPAEHQEAENNSRLDACETSLEAVIGVYMHQNAGIDWRGPEGTSERRPVKEERLEWFGQLWIKPYHLPQRQSNPQVHTSGKEEAARRNITMVG